MNLLKKSISVFISSIMLVTVFLPLIASASSCSVSVSGASGRQGDIVTVNVDISSIPLGAFVINLNYDNSKLEFVSASKGAAASALENSTVNSVGSSQVRCTAATSEMYNTTVSGNVMSVKFKIIASSGSTSITTSGEVYESSGTKIAVAFSENAITVLNNLPPFNLGDVTGDSQIDSADAIYILRSDAGLITLSEKQKLAADVTKDGNIDVADAIKIARYDAQLIPNI